MKRLFICLILVLSLFSDGTAEKLLIYHPLYRGEPAPVFDPQAQRGVEYVKYLSPSVRIRVTGASGSGTIVYYDQPNNLAYVCSCGHLFARGTMTAEQGKQKNLTCQVEVFYHNNDKLGSPQKFTAKVLFYSYLSGADYSCMVFTPDFQPSYYPIAPVDYALPAGKHLHSCGCDHASEVAHYDVEVVNMRGDDLVTKLNSPRPGRSGGGLMTDDGYYVGICWGTSDTSGNGIGLFTPLKVIHDGYSKNGYQWLLNKKPGETALARELPIIDRQNTGRQYPKEFILIPGSR